MQSGPGRDGFLNALKNGVRVEYLVETFCDASRDGTLTMKPEIEEQLTALFEHAPK